MVFKSSQFVEGFDLLSNFVSGFGLWLLNLIKLIMSSLTCKKQKTVISIDAHLLSFASVTVVLALIASFHNQ